MENNGDLRPKHEKKAKKLENFIDKLKGANLGDADRLGRMIQMLKEGSDLESADKQYLKKLYKQYKNENKETKKITPVGYAMIIVIIAAIVGGVMVLLTEESGTAQSELERQRDLESSNAEFNTELVESAKENIPLMQSLPRVILEQCRAVKSYSDYQTFLIVVGIMSDELLENFETMNTLLTALEIQGYDKHPEVGPLIKETRDLAGRTSDCMDDLTRKYGN